MTLRFAALASLLGLATTAHAFELGSDDPAPVQIHAFASQGYIKSWHNNYLARSSETRGSFEFTETGINASKNLTDKLRMGLQLFARKLGPLGNYNAKMDWFYIDYRWKDWLGIRAGRVKIPFGLYNEINDVDSARVSVLLPQAVYPTQNRDFLLAQTGAELYGLVPLNAAGALEYRLYAGTIFVDNVNRPGAPYIVQEIRVPYVIGGRVMWETPVEGLRVGGSVQGLRLDANLIAGTETAALQVPAVLWIASAEYSYSNLLLAAEYSRWHVKADSNNPAVFPSVDTVNSERAYVLAAYHVTEWLQPSVYYSLLFPNVKQREGRAAIQNDIAATLRFDINAHWLVKLEGHYMIGTGGLDATLNDNVPLSQLTKDWTVVFIKTTAYF